jgi:hypothetical protein
MLDLTACPEPGCQSPAEIIDRCAFGSTDGPIEHVRIRCLYRHTFLLPAEMLRSPHQAVRRPNVETESQGLPAGD